jgi:DNA primase catalytic core
MARLSDTELDMIKQRISLLRLIESQGYELKQQGKDYVTHCPFHDDATPSLVITPDKNLFHCFGCGAAGTVIDWVMKTEGVSFRHAVELLAQDYEPTASNKKPIKRATVNKLNPTFTTSTEDQTLLNRVIEYYHNILKQSPDALAYCDKRGISAEAIEHFKLGVANRTLGYRLPKANRKQGAALRGQLQKIGIYRESGHEHFSGSLIIPVIDEHENVQEVYGRKLLDTLRKGTPKHLYLPGPHQGIFNLAAYKASKELILCESLIDALTFWSNGYRNVTSSYGTSGFTDEHIKAMQTHAIERVLIAYDRDEAGETAAQKLSKQLIDKGIECYRIQFPKGMDANEYALSVTPANKSLGLVIRKALWLGAGKAPMNKVLDTSPALVAEVSEPLPASPLPELSKATDINTEQNVVAPGRPVPATLGHPSLTAKESEAKAVSRR